MKNTKSFIAAGVISIVVIISAFSAAPGVHVNNSREPKAFLIPATKIYFNSFVDCNMAEAWIGDTFRIFPGKYGEYPLWGYARDLKFTDDKNAEEAFTNNADAFTEAKLPHFCRRSR